MLKRLPPQQMLALQVSERVMSVLSVLGSLFILTTFTKWRYFRKPINRLVFYASFGNILANIATLISTAALDDQAGAHGLSHLCELQGIVIQWFLMADSLWVLCMALNVMFVFFWGFNHNQLRHLEPYYLGFAYGLPALPSFAYIIIDHASANPVIGPATIWCWVSKDYEWMRLAFFYGPVWIVICCTATIYIVTGRKIFQKRALLRSFSRHMTNEKIPEIANPFTAANINNIERKTDIHIVTETMDSDCTAASPSTESRSSFASTRKLSSRPPQSQPARTRESAHITFSRPTGSIPQVRGPGQARTYSVNISADKPSMDEESADPRPPTAQHTAPPMVRRTAAMEGNAAAWGYMKVAFLMFTALFIVWVPSTVNRVQQLVHEDQPIFALNLASALVLPLQGFWNAMVYIATTWPECKRALSSSVDFFKTKQPQDAHPNQLPLNSSPHKDSTRSLTRPDDDYEMDLNHMLWTSPPQPSPKREKSKAKAANAHDRSTVEDRF